MTELTLSPEYAATLVGLAFQERVLPRHVVKKDGANIDAQFERLAAQTRDGALHRYVGDLKELLLCHDDIGALLPRSDAGPAADAVRRGIFGLRERGILTGRLSDPLEVDFMRLNDQLRLSGQPVLDNNMESFLDIYRSAIVNSVNLHSHFYNLLFRKAFEGSSFRQVNFLWNPKSAPPPYTAEYYCRLFEFVCLFHLGIALEMATNCMDWLYLKSRPLHAFSNFADFLVAREYANSNSENPWVASFAALVRPMEVQLHQLSSWLAREGTPPLGEYNSFESYFRDEMAPLIAGMASSAASVPILVGDFQAGTSDPEIERGLVRSATLQSRASAAVRLVIGERLEDTAVKGGIADIQKWKRSAVFKDYRECIGQIVGQAKASDGAIDQRLVVAASREVVRLQRAADRSACSSIARLVAYLSVPIGFAEMVYGGGFIGLSMGVVGLAAQVATDGSQKRSWLTRLRDL